MCLYVHDLGCVFTGDTLFEGGPGATGRSYSDADLIMDSIRRRLLELPDETVVHTGHGPDTTIGAEREGLSGRRAGSLDRALAAAYGRRMTTTSSGSATTSLVTDDFVLEPLGPQHNESDHAAWSSSIAHVRATPGYADGSWPPVGGMSLEDNLADLTRHAADFEARRGFTFTVLDPGSREVIGCVYLYPAGPTSTTSRCSRGCGPTGPGSTSRWQMPWPPGSRATGPGSVRTVAGGELSVVPCHHVGCAPAPPRPW